MHQTVRTTSGHTQSLPMYQCHKRVQACRIKAVTRDDVTGAWTIVPEEGHLEPFLVTESYVKRHNPRVGGFFVRCRDGYSSFSPAREFEDGYLPIDALTQRRMELEGQLADVTRAIANAAEQHHPQGETL